MPDPVAARRAEEEQKEVRSQRHDFIKEYYKMAVTDLDRHIKGGWQTIAILAGGAVILTAGHDQKIGMPIAALIALVTAFWGMVNVVDANYWSLRAIAFLSNVEAIYFSASDRKVFNPYIGHHPPFKLMNSLKYLFGLSMAFGIATVLSVLWELTGRYQSPVEIMHKAATLPWLRLILWMSPIITAFWGIWFVYATMLNRSNAYFAFVSKTPGPGVREDAAQLRHVTLQPVFGSTAPTLEQDSHTAGIADLQGKRSDLGRQEFVAKCAAVVMTLGAAIAVIIRAFGE